MNKSLDQVSLQVLIRPYKNKFVGMCPEMGLYFEENSFDEVQKRLYSCMALTLEAVEKDETLIDSLTVGMDLEHSFFFYRSSIEFQFIKMFRDMRKFFVVQGNAASIGTLVAACG